MLRFRELKAATEEFNSAALLGSGWGEAVERLAEAARVTGAVLMCYHGNSLKAELPSAGLEEAYARFHAGDAPFCSRLARIRLGLGEGFRVDHDDYSDEELARDPFYQEFMAPRGAFWNAVAKLAAAPDDWSVELGFKRDLKAGPYTPADREVLNALLPDLRAAARVGARALDIESAGLVQPLHRRGDPIFELDAWGRVRRIHGGSDADPSPPVRVVGRRLVAADRVEQPGLERAIAAAVTPPQRSALASLHGGGQRYYLQCIPVAGRARDVFLATAAVAVVIAATCRPKRRCIDPRLLREAFALTDREAQVAGLLAEGLDLPEIARCLGIDPGTARNHLKSVFEKSGTHRQAELVALLARICP